MGLLILISTACTDKSRFVEPDFILRKWSRAIEEMNYKDYASCEAYPKEEGVFREMYREYYPVDLHTVKLDDHNEKDVKTDFEKNRYVKRIVYFEGSLVDRKLRRVTELIKGDALFIRFLDGKRERDGWLLSNRTIMRMKIKK